MSEYTIEITPHSKVIIFQGNLKKAPPLNKRGRKKWKDRYFVLRANKSLECYKSKKAAESSKNPRKVIDLRECINLEVGLEYKELQHIMSLGTFKRTFFLAAPSDALMLQWIDNIEKVKNAIDGEQVRILDISLRKSPLRTVVSMTTSSSMSKINAICSGSLYQTGLSQSSSALTHITRHHPGLAVSASREAMSDGERSPSYAHSHRGYFLHHRQHTPPITTAKTYRQQEEPGLDSMWERSGSSTEPWSNRSQSYVSEGGDSSNSRERARTHDGVRKMRQYVNVSPRPPPSPKKAKPSRPHDPGKDTFSASKQGGTPVTAKQKDKKQAMVDGLPPSGAKIPPPKIASRFRKDSIGSEDTNPISTLLQQQGVQTIQQNLTALGELAPVMQITEASPVKIHRPPPLHGMKHSFRYRKISLKQEQPIFQPLDEESTDEEDDTEVETDTDTAKSPLYSKKHKAKSSPNLSIIGRGARTRRVATHVQREEQESPLSSHCVPRSYSPSSISRFHHPTSYSKVTVVGVKVASIEPRIFDNDVTRRPMLSLRNSNSEGTLRDSRPMSYGMPPPMAVEVFSDSEEFVLPVRHPSDTYTHSDSHSVTSLDGILVDPPAMFEGIHFNSPKELQHKKKDDKPVHGSPRTEVVSLKGEEKDDEEDGNRNSTESCDTGYNSSPGSAKMPDSGAVKNWNENQKGKTDKQTVHIPLVFFNKKTSRKSTRMGLQVCLVENHHKIIKDLIAMKNLEGYFLVECDSEYAASTVTTSAGDAYTVEMSLEDIEFGFSVVCSTQKDFFRCKVRQFHFEIKNLFNGNRKPFSCEVHIRHANEVTVLPVEVNRV